MDLKHQLNLKELELNALLEVTEAINNNLPEEALYKIYNFTLRANLNINKLALYVWGKQWECKVNFGTDIDFFKTRPDDMLFSIKDVSKIKENISSGDFLEFDTIIPVFHKNQILAHVFIGEVNSDIAPSFGDITFLQALTNIIIVAIENKRLARQELQQQAINKELEIAKKVQLMLFPKVLPCYDKIKVAAKYLPHEAVGGDYYDFIKLEGDRYLFCIGDVSGKGIPAALLMSNFQACLRTLLRQSQDLKFIIKELNYQILQSARGENFISVFIAIFDEHAKKLNYINAGHNPPVLIKDEKIILLDSGATIIGCFDPLPILEESQIENLDNFTLFAYTDGLTEVFNENNEEFGAERLEELIQKYEKNDPDEINRLLIEHINMFKGTGPLKDDITILSFKYCTNV